jgi:hypothetical protein
MKKKRVNKKTRVYIIYNKLRREFHHLPLVANNTAATEICILYIEVKEEEKRPRYL